MVWLFEPRNLGFRAETTDSFLFVKRLNTSDGEGVAAVNFAPSPGVTFGGTYLAQEPIRAGFESRDWAECYFLELERSHFRPRHEEILG